MPWSIFIAIVPELITVAIAFVIVVLYVMYANPETRGERPIQAFILLALSYIALRGIEIAHFLP